MCDRSDLNTAAGFAHFKSATLLLIASFVAMYAASVASRSALFLYDASIDAPPNLVVSRERALQKHNNPDHFAYFFCSFSLLANPLPVSPM